MLPPKNLCGVVSQLMHVYRFHHNSRANSWANLTSMIKEIKICTRSLARGWRVYPGVPAQSSRQWCLEIIRRCPQWGVLLNHNGYFCSLDPWPWLCCSCNRTSPQSVCSWTQIWLESLEYTFGNYPVHHMEQRDIFPQMHLRGSEIAVVDTQREDILPGFCTVKGLDPACSW